MKISQKQKELLFKCIFEEVVDLQIALAKANGVPLYHTNNDVDEKIAHLDNNIWKRIKKELNIK